MQARLTSQIVLVLAMAVSTQLLGGQVSPSSPPAAGRAVSPGQQPPAPAKAADLPASPWPGAVPDSSANGTASLAPQGTRSSSPGSSRPQDAAADRFHFKADVNLVLMEATVRGPQGVIVSNLGREDFRVYENGVEQQISYFSREELPLAVALVLDSSGSMGPVLRQMHKVAYESLSALRPDDQVALFDFAARADLRVGLTRNRQRIANAIATIRPAGGTVIPDALYEAALYLSQAAPGRRPAIILISDNASNLKGYANEDRVIRQALESEAAIYSIQVEPGEHPHSMYVILPEFRDVSVPRIIHETGGELIAAHKLESIGSALSTAISRLKWRYNIGYYSNNRRRDGAFREVEIRVSASPPDPQSKFSVYARRGYYAGAEGAPLSDPQP